MKKIHEIIYSVVVFILCISSYSYAQENRVMSWSDCISETIQNNPSLAASRQVVKQYKAKEWTAASPALPQISTDLSLDKSDSFSGGSSNDNKTYSVKGEQLVFDGFKTFSDIKSAKENLKGSKYAYVVNSSDIRYSLRKAFVELLRAQELIPISKGIITRRKQNFDMIKLKYESGSEHQGSLLLAEADLAQAEFDLKKAERAISVAQYALKKEMGWNNDISIKVSGDFKIAADNAKSSSFEEVAKSHPLVSEAKAQKESAKYAVESVKAEFFPEIKLTGEAGKIRSGGFTSDEKGWTFGLNLSLPVLEGGRRVAATKDAAAKLMQSKFDEQSQYDTVLSSLEAAWQALQDAIDNLEVQEKYLKAAEMRARISRAEYANGLLIFDNWIIIEDNYVSAQKAYVNAQASLLLAEAEWMKAKGEDLEYN